jgi:cell division protein FtsX
LFASHAPIIEDITIFEKEQRSRELEKELEATLNFLKRTITSTAKPIPQVIVISNSKEKVEIRPQPVVEEISQSIHVLRPMEEVKLQQHVIEEQPQLIPILRLVEEKKLQKPMNNGEAFLQEFVKQLSIPLLSVL